MNLFEFTLVNIVFTLFPLLIYLIYVAYSTSISKKETNLFLEFALFSSIYLVIRYGKPMDGEKLPILIINVPLIIAYLKKRPIGIALISTFLILYYQCYFNSSWGLLMIEYSLYLILFLVKERKKIQDKVMIIAFLVIKALFFGYLSFQNYYEEIPWDNFTIEIATMILLLMVVTYVSLLLFHKGEDILKLHMTMKELEKEKQIRMSLFQITHEIKNPIAVCKGYLDMFDTNNKEHSKKYIPILKEEIERTLILLQDFLSIQKIKIEKDILDMNLLLEEILTSLEPLFKEKKIEVSTNIIDDEIYMNADYNRLKQVFINILKNSIEAMTNDKKHKLRIEVGELKEEVEVKIIDNGVGIEKENLKKIKNPFFSTKQNGTGLGVFLSSEIVKAHNGKIEFFSDNNGTTVTLIFPKNMK
ncbi:MAG: HAMP domain-containing histidine kinase [Bacilli bacterium]|nr:HAMP domain-containing histidine kinase [Bacilli bacterium]